MAMYKMQGFIGAFFYLIQKVFYLPNVLCVLVR